MLYLLSHKKNFSILEPYVILLQIVFTLFFSVIYYKLGII
jgi:hypothetical protein